MKTILVVLLLIIAGGVSYLVWTKESERRERAESLSAIAKQEAAAARSIEEELVGSYIYSMEGGGPSMVVVLNSDHTGTMVTRINGKSSGSTNGRWTADSNMVWLAEGGNDKGTKFLRLGEKLKMIAIGNESVAVEVVLSKVPAILVAK